MCNLKQIDFFTLPTRQRVLVHVISTLKTYMKCDRVHGYNQHVKLMFHILFCDISTIV